MVSQTVKHLYTMRETWVQSLGREDPLEKEMAIHSSTIAWKIPWILPGNVLEMSHEHCLEMENPIVHSMDIAWKIPWKSKYAYIYFSIKLYFI